jgi:sugar phosphate isomerase/epimerase
MITIGILTRIFERSTVEDVFTAIAGQEIRTVQFSFLSAGLAALPSSVEPEMVERIRSAAEANAISIDAVSGTFNVIDPDRARLDGNMARFSEVLKAAEMLGSPYVTLCSGTRDLNDMWRAHPENSSSEAWKDLIASLEPMLVAAELRNVTLLVEPEPGNVISSAKRARCLLDEMQSPRLGILFDAANLVAESTDLSRTMAEAFDLLGPDIKLAHAKELSAEGPGGVPGTGRLDWHAYIEGLQARRYRGPLMLHGFDEKDVPAAVSFLRDFKVLASDTLS